MKTTFLALAAVLAVSGCKYDNTFTGTYTDAATNTASTGISLDAYSKNVNKYCVKLTLNTPQKWVTGISASEVIDSNDVLASKSFNTRESNCNPDETTYLVGSRSTQVLSTHQVYELQRCSFNYCDRVAYKRYDYVENIQFNVIDSRTGATKGSFQGTGEPSAFIDDSRIVNHTGCVIYCPQSGPRIPPRGGRGHP